MDPLSYVSLLEHHGYVDETQKQMVLDEQQTHGKEVLDVVEDLGILSKADQYNIIASDLGTSVVDLAACQFTPDLLERITPQAARLHGALPVYYGEGVLYVALVNPIDSQIVENLRFAVGGEMQVLVAPIAEVQEKIDQYYGAQNAELDDLLSELSGVDLPGEGNGEKLALEGAAAGPIIKFVNTVLAQAIKARASDIHFEPFEYDFKIRYRVDGALYEMSPPPKSLAIPITSRIKVMANLNIAERRVPQDGRIQSVIGGKPVDLRVSCLPTQFGESVVLRVLDRSAVNLDLEALNLPPYIYTYICEAIEKPNGIFIVTGPTGSGKTTTLYSCLRRINSIETKILTVEDPVEYEMEGVMQVPANEGIGLNFARVLRAFLRQDPDKIMVGETRDLETAQIAIQASLTGHLVLTTLHTNDAPGAVTRLIDMGVEPFLIASALEGVLAQRLVRKICKNCRTPYEPSETVLAQFGLSAHEVGDKNFYYGAGCDQCNQTGYKGRKGIYELLDISEPIRDLINQRAPSVVIRQKAIELGMVTLRSDGLRNIFDGETTIEEVLKYT
ncbi:type IV pilus assembly protein PilB [Verrucomicrobium sp. GAS474]|uniref:GspE/PulE family protein n=1 Tax=Verrucomicrobium sp. GAS474 TaxID=1882831 RepID=UPI00087955B2|nr:GspE/PulE family protein [Verrucomicrobium sp. GAS474]SDU20998.1 type IV pilus assembly protein PilB [Verrucomicrobium sp. GAS474]